MNFPKRNQLTQSFYNSFLDVKKMMSPFEKAFSCLYQAWMNKFVIYFLNRQ